ncbi:MAG: HAMP domain-containing histidine kinase [Rhizobacter sp.]|nr:HAMP domain-containing histidine kinase [Ferruginibacter sp.]
MRIKKYKLIWFIRLLVLFLLLCAAAFCFAYKQNVVAVITAVIAVLYFNAIYKQLLKPYRQISEFAEAVFYRDFSKNYTTSPADKTEHTLNNSFNTINNVLKELSIEKEAQFLYLQTMLELIDTGVISYRPDTGEITWMNESLKNIIKLPQFKSVYFLEKRNEILLEEMLSLKAGENKMISIDVEHIPTKLLISATSFTTDGINYHLVAFKNVDEVVDETEAKAWQKLLSVMTHEIMNSVAPISSLADTLKKRLGAEKINFANPDVMEDIELGIDTIKSRSEGLLKFTATYRNLNKVTHLNLEAVPVIDLFENLLQLMQPTLTQKNIEAEIILKNTHLTLMADIHFVEQVLINLLVNAIEAVKNNKGTKKITLTAEQRQQKIWLQVADNGMGIEQDLLDKVFIPFFSTKKTGSGIGLSLCRQIMLLHKGSISVQSKINEGAVFVLQFPVTET